MNTVQKNFSIVEGSKSRMIVRMDESLDLDTFEVYAGNEKCKCRMMKYHEASKEDHIITLISDPAPSNVQSIPYQIFIKDTSTNIEWLVVSGNISVITRYVGAPGDSTIEINPPLDEEVIDIDVEVTYTKADLDEAVRQAREAADRAYAWAEGDPGSEGYSSFHWASVAEQAVSDIGSSVESAWCAAGKSQEWSELARQYKEQSCCYKKLAFNYAGAAEAYATTSTLNANRAERAEQLSCQGATISRNNALCARKWAMCAAGYKNGAQLSASSAETYKNQALSYMNQSCSYASTASTKATLAEQYALCAGSYASIASNAQSYSCSAASISSSKAHDAYTAADNAACYMRKTCEYLDEVTGIAATKQDLLTWDTLPVEDSDNPVRSSGVFLLTNFPECADDRWHPGADCGMPQNFLYKTQICDGTLNLSNLTVGKLATAELWIDYHGGSVVWPNNWYWIDAVNDQYCYPPMRCCMAESTRYAISARNDGYKTVANVQYNYPLN